MLHEGTMPSSNPLATASFGWALALGGLALANARAFASLELVADRTLAMSLEYFVIVPFTLVFVVAHAISSFELGGRGMVGGW